MLDKVIYLNLLDGGRRHCERGATASEYGLLVAFIAFGVLAAVTALGDEIAAFFTALGTTVAGW